MGASWYPEIVAAARFPSALAFAHVGAFHRTPDFSVRVAAEFGALNTSWLEVGGSELSDWCGSATRDDVALVDLDALDLKSPRSEEVLSNLRPAVTGARERGARVVFVSTRQLAEFPALAGSSILLDAETVAMRAVADEVALDLAADLGLTSTVAQRNVSHFSAGSRALIWTFVEIDSMAVGGNQKRQVAAARERSLARMIFDQLGAELCT